MKAHLPHQSQPDLLYHGSGVTGVSMLQIHTWIRADQSIGVPINHVFDLLIFHFSSPLDHHPPLSHWHKTSYKWISLLPTFIVHFFFFFHFFSFQAMKTGLATMQHQYALSTQSLVFSITFTVIFATIFLCVLHNNDTYTHTLSTLPLHTTGFNYLVGTQMYLSSFLTHWGLASLISACVLFSPSHAF